MTKQVNRVRRYRESGEAEIDSHFKKDKLRIEEDVLISDRNGTRFSDQKELLFLASVSPHHKKLLHSEGHVVRWERFFPIKSLKVLLVENDHCTRQVVSALLRNCCYEVTSTGNGLEAWKILEDSNNYYDLVLTEVVVPGLSGIDLLCKIMGHKTLRSIPVIMMSSHDPMGIVFKCLSKGAVDFLVKPIRKNELKNLWQHVWRRGHSSSGSENGVQTERSLKSNSDESNNNIGSNDEDRNASISMIFKDGSDNGSGTQACSGKQIHDNISKEEDPKIKLQGSFSGYNVSFLNKNLPPNITGSLMEEKSVNYSKKNNHPPNDDLMELDCNKHSAQEADAIVTVVSNNLPPSKPALTRDDGTVTIKERNILRHSDVSAFSRYITCASSAVSNHILTECEVNYSFPVDSSSKAAKMKVSYSPPVDQGSNDSGSNNNYMKCTTNNATTYSEKTATISVVKATHASAFHPVQPRSTTTNHEKINDFTTGVKVALPKVVHPHVQGRQQAQNQSGQDESNVNIVSSSVPQCGSSNGHSVVPEEYNTGDYNINRSGSSSNNHGSNGNTGFIVDSGIGNRNGINEKRFWSTQREAALNKFRQKRKERCFEKKVRYQNRKKLAEQRPRVRGQFVRQVHDMPNVF